MRLPLSDSFRREGLAAVLYVALIATLIAESGSGHLHGAARYRALAGGLIFVGLGMVRTREAITLRKASKAFKAVGMFVVALTELLPVAGRHSGTVWWFAPAAACVVLVVGSICLALVLWQREQDERERAIVNAATTVAFFVTMTVVLVFFLLDRLEVASITASWVLLTAAASWFAAWFVLQERM
jgi:hypothetical protein